MERRSSYFILTFFFFSLFTPYLYITPVDALHFTSSSLWFYIDEPGIIDYPEMEFNVGNDGEETLRVNCSYQEVEGINITVHFDWETITLNGSEWATNRYWIEANITFAVTHIVVIKITQQFEDSDDQQIGVGGNVINRITFYSGDSGALLDLDIVDQSGSPRISIIDIYYKQNTSLSWSPIRTVNGTGFNGYLPLGYYLVQATDNETGIFGESKFEVWNDTTQDVILRLVGFDIFMYKLDNKSRLSVYCTVDNRVGTISGVKIYGELYFEGNLIETSNVEEKQEFDPIEGLELTLAFGSIDWRIGNYSIVGIIKSFETMVATTHLNFDVPELPDKPATFDPINVLLFGGLLAIVFTFTVRELNNRKKLKLLKQELESKYENSKNKVKNGSN